MVHITPMTKQLKTIRNLIENFSLSFVRYYIESRTTASHDMQEQETCFHTKVATYEY